MVTIDRITQKIRSLTTKFNLVNYSIFNYSNMHFLNGLYHIIVAIVSENDIVALPIVNKISSFPSIDLRTKTIWSVLLNCDKYPETDMQR